MRVCRCFRQSADDGREAFNPFPVSRMRKELFCTLERSFEPGIIERLQEIVQRLCVKRTERVLIIRCDKDRQRHTLHAHGPDDIESGHLWHLDVEEHEVGFLRRDLFHCLDAVPAFGHDVHIIVLREEESQRLPRKRFVVHDYRADVLQGIPFLSGSKGISTVATTEPSLRSSRAKRCRSA